MSSALRVWCKRHGINHREFSDDFLVRLRCECRSVVAGGYKTKRVGEQK